MIGPPHRISRGFASLAAIVVVFVAVPVGLVAAARSRFGAANPLAEIDPPWRWARPTGRCRRAAATRRRRRQPADPIQPRHRSGSRLAVIAVTIVTEAVHMARHQGLPAPPVRGIGWAQRIGRWVAVGLIALLPANSFASTANASGDPSPAATAQRFGLVTGSAIADPSGNDGSGPIASFGPDEASIPATARPSAPAGSERLPRPDDSMTEVAPTTASSVHVVERGESIYAIAAEYAAGDEARTIEIADLILDLNLDNVMDDGQRFTNPALIRPGWTLVLPTGVGTPRPSHPVIDVPDHRTRRHRRRTRRPCEASPASRSMVPRTTTRQSATRPTSSSEATRCPTSPTNTSAISRTGRRSGRRTAATTWAADGPSTIRT